MAAPESAFDRQIGGNHYKSDRIQLFDFCFLNNIGKAEGDVIYYVARWRKKNGLEDLRKARHTLDMLIERVEAEEKTRAQKG